MSAKKDLSKGSLLLEALLTVVILSTSLTFIIQGLTASQRAVVYSTDYIMAGMLLENKLFELIQNGSIAAYLSQEEGFPAPYERFQYFLETRPWQGEDSQNLNEVILTVSWQKGKKKSQIEIHSCLFNLQEE